MISADDFVLLIKQTAQEQIGSVRTATLGYVAGYDPTTATITAVVPSYCSPDPQTGAPTPVVVGPIRLGTSWAGNGIGLQVAPAKAGATPQDPTQGEPVLIVQLGHGTGISVAAVMLFNATFAPPDTALAAGDAILKGAGGATIKLQGGNIVIQGGSTPVAVEGSKTTHQHGLSTFVDALVTALNTDGSAPLTGTSLAAIFSGLTPAPPAPSTAVTDSADAPVVAGQGAQDVLAPGPGGS